MNEIYNFFEDTLMEWDKHKKKYCFSMRRICIAVCFPYALKLGWHLVFDQNVTQIGLQVFQSIFLFITVGLGYNLYSYMKNEKQEEPNNNQNNEPL